MSTTLISPSAKRTTGFARLRSIIAFTLVELLAVVAIIAILAGLVLGGSVYAKRKAMVSTTKAQLVTLENAIEAYKNDFGMYPTSSLSRPSTIGDRHNDAGNGGAWFGSDSMNPFDNINFPQWTSSFITQTITNYFLVQNNWLLYQQLVGTGKGTNGYYTIKPNQVISSIQNQYVASPIVLLADPYGTPWGYYYCMISPANTAQVNQATFDLWSYGQDKASFGNASDPSKLDDITNFGR